MPKYHPQKQGDGGGWRSLRLARSRVVTRQPAATTRADAYYCNSLVTACCVLLACASALMPVWVRIWNFDSCDVAVV
jgi:hypothetical protein